MSPTNQSFQAGGDVGVAPHGVRQHVCHNLEHLAIHLPGENAHAPIALYAEELGPALLRAAAIL